MDSKDVEEIFKGVLTDENHPNPGYQAPPPNVLPPPVPTGKMKYSGLLTISTQTSSMKTEKGRVIRGTKLTQKADFCGFCYDVTQ